MRHADALTIIVPLYGRENLSQLFLSYLQHIKCPFKVLFADGSLNDQSSLINRTNFPDVNLEYYRFPYDKDIQTYMKKMKEIYTKVRTPLTVMMDNDDLFCLNGLYEGIEFLSENPDYWGYRQDVRELRWNGNGAHSPRSIYELPNIDGDDSLQRVFSSITNRNALWHDITRSSVHTEFFDVLDTLEVNDLQCTVSLQCYYPPVFGKIRRGAEKPYYFHIPGHSVVQGTGKLTRFVRWMESPLFDVSAGQSISVMGNVIARNSIGVSVEEAKKVFAHAFFKSLIETTNEQTSSNYDVEQKTIELVEKHLESAKNYDKRVAECLNRSVKSIPFALDEKLSRPFTTEQALEEIREFGRSYGIF